MDPTITIALVDYIHLLHKEKRDKSLFAYFEPELKICTAHEVNIAIESLMLRYKRVEDLEYTVAKFIKAATLGLRDQSIPEYPTDSIFHILEGENMAIEALLSDVKKTYLEIMPGLKENRIESKKRFGIELEKIETVKKHYLKLQYGVFPALESEGIPARCTQLMWHLEDSIWPKWKDSLKMLLKENWDYIQFSRIYGQMFFMLRTLVFRENRILFPMAYQSLSEDIQRKLILDADSYGIVNES